ncbi:MAG: 7-cyano-7-deazaguanine synthase QueC [Spirochaetota bacterium]|nr:7-cyano-7-deazaguanine synthase QueC [Spirochaetota bacterium]
MDKALVLLSGGQDSCTCLYWAKKVFSEVEGICFDYGQRHKVELDAARIIAEKASVKLSKIPINSFKALGNNSLTGEAEVSSKLGDNQLPNTFVPGRNLIFLFYAAAFAYEKNIVNLVGGMNQTDYSGYPDCRNNTLLAMELAINLGMDKEFHIHAPLMYKTKKDIWALAHELGCLDVVKEISHSCYNGVRGGCGECQACTLRLKGLRDFEESIKSRRET